MASPSQLPIANNTNTPDSQTESANTTDGHIVS